MVAEKLVNGNGIKRILAGDWVRAFCSLGVKGPYGLNPGKGRVVRRQLGLAGRAE